MFSLCFVEETLCYLLTLLTLSLQKEWSNFTKMSFYKDLWTNKTVHGKTITRKCPTNRIRVNILFTESNSWKRINISQCRDYRIIMPPRVNLVRKFVLEQGRMNDKKREALLPPLRHFRNFWCIVPLEPVQNAHLCISLVFFIVVA